MFADWYLIVLVFDSVQWCSGYVSFLAMLRNYMATTSCLADDGLLE